MLAKDIRPGMVIREGKALKQVMDTPFPCDRYKKVHVKMKKAGTDGNGHIVCYDRMAEVESV